MIGQSRQILLEACVSSVKDAVAAVEQGVDRLELNCALELGGLTPTAGLLQQVKESVDVPVMVMVRPRAGGFCYSESERRLIRRETRILLQNGADGIVMGAITRLGEIDLDLVRDVKAACESRTLVFHRAFDSLPQPTVAMEELVRCGVGRVLTSGGCKSAIDGVSGIAALIDCAEGRIEILPGGGVTAQNVRMLIEQTGCQQVHGSFKSLLHDPAGLVGAPTYPALDAALIGAVREELDCITQRESDSMQ